LAVDACAGGFDLGQDALDVGQDAAPSSVMRSSAGAIEQAGGKLTSKAWMRLGYRSA